MTVANSSSTLGVLSSVIVPNTTWTCVICAFETDFAAGLKLAKMYFGDTDVTGLITDVSASFNIKTNGLQFAVGSISLGSTMALADFRFMPGVNLLTAGDIALGTRRLFIDGNGKPVDPATATASLGTPAVLLSGDVSGFVTNQGNGGAFTLSGTLTNASTSPSD